MKNSKKSILLVVSLLLVTALVAACSSTSTPGAPTSEPTAQTSTISVSGSTTVQPLAEKLAEAFTTENAGIRIDVQGGGSSVGVKAAAEGTSDIGMASREIKDSELTEFPNLKVFVIARDGIAIVTHPDTPVSDLTIDQVRDIFSGKITNWKDVGGEDQSIILVSREEGSGTRAAFEEMVMGEDALIAASSILQPSNGSVRTTVATTPNSIGYLSFGYLDNTVKTISINGVAPTEANAVNGTYPIVRPLNMLTNGEPTGTVKAFLDFILSEAGQKIVVDDGYISVTPSAPTSEPTAQTSTISVSGSTTVQPLAEKLAEAFTTENAGIRIDVQGGGSSVGVKAAAEGTSDIGMASREIKDSELTEFPNLKVFVIARDGIAIVTHPDTPVSDLTIDQVRDIFSGKITNWKDVGGEDQSIILVSREEGSGTRAAFEEMVMGEDALIAASSILQPSNGSVRTTVATTPNSIGYLSFGYLDNTVKTISINGVAPTEANAVNGTYPIVRPLNMLTNGEPTGTVKAFLDFILSEAGQKIVVDDGYISVK